MRTPWRYLRRQLDAMLFTGKVGTLFCLLYTLLLTAYAVSGERPTNPQLAEIVASWQVWLYVSVYAVLIAVAVRWPIVGGTLALSFIGVAGAIPYLEHPLTLVSLVTLLLQLSLVGFALHGMIEWAIRRQRQEEARRELEKQIETRR
jgi:hypothetical protein